MWKCRRHLNKDGLLDVVAYSRGAGVFGGSQISVSWNRGSSFRYDRLSYSGDTIVGFEVYDHDGDADLDLFFITGKDGNPTNVYQQVVMSNLGGRFDVEQVLGTPLAVPYLGLHAMDFNGDDRMDLIFAGGLDYNYWRDGQTGVMEPITGLGRIQDVIDIDGDQRLDLISLIGSQFYYSPGRAEGRIGDPRLLLTQPNAAKIVFGDVSGDGRPDLVTTSPVLEVIRTFKNRVVGDANGDGRFDSADLVAIMQAGQYEDSLYRNSDFASGDWNGDREFDASDLIFAMQAGDYQFDEDA